MFAMFFVWFASVVPFLSVVIGGAALVMLIALGVWFIATALHNETNRPAKKYPIAFSGGKWLLALGMVMSLFWAVIPSERTVYMMGGAYIGQSVVQSEAADKVKKILEAKLDEYVDELSAKKKIVKPVETPEVKEKK